MLKNKSCKVGISIVIIQLLFISGIISALENDSLQQSYSTHEELSISQINVTFNSSGYELYAEIYYPSNSSEIYPGIVFCEGMGGYVYAYNWIPKALAEEGYVTIVFDFPGQGISEGFLSMHMMSIPLLNLYLRFTIFVETPIHYFLRDWVTATSDALTYLLEESYVKEMIDGSTIGLIGHSLGGITATETAVVDDRFDVVVALSQGNPLIIKKLNVPVQFQGGCFDIGTYSIPIVSRCYKKANSPKELIAIQSGTHLGFSTALNQLNPSPPWQREICLRYAIGWFDYFLKNNTGAYDTITTGLPHLSKIIQSRYDFGDGEHIISESI
jgi:dienelactone hydrolase